MGGPHTGYQGNTLWGIPGNSTQWYTTWATRGQRRYRYEVTAVVPGTQVPQGTLVAYGCHRGAQGTLRGGTKWVPWGGL